MLVRRRARKTPGYQNTGMQLIDLQSQELADWRAQGLIDDIPMFSLCRTIEIDLREVLSEKNLYPAIKGYSDFLCGNSIGAIPLGKSSLTGWHSREFSSFLYTMRCDLKKSE